MSAADSGEYRRDLLGRALAASLLAGDAVMEVYDSDFEVRYKSDRSPITEADWRSHRILVSHLGGEIPILSEEGSAIDFEKRKAWNLFWLIDPLDGTKEFVKRNGEFTVNVALMKQNDPVVGIVYLPAKTTLFFGGRGFGAYRIRGASLAKIRKSPLSTILESALGAATPLPLRRSAHKGKSVRIVQSVSHVTSEETDFIGRLKSEVPDIETAHAGSSLKFCLLAEGSADLYPRFGPTMEWDTAAGHCVAASAGAEILGLTELSPLCYNKPVLRNDAFMAIGPRIRAEAFVRDAALLCARKCMASGK
jgi:3'(2'), 5'-bisphosphate nucleotidase